MRQRRAERCVLRAEAAIESGDEMAAVEALAEAKALDWKAPEFATLRTSVVEKKAAAAAVEAARAAALQRAARLQRTRRTIAAAALGITAFSGSAALMYKAASRNGTPVPSPLVTVSRPLPSSSASPRAETAPPVAVEERQGPAPPGTAAATPDEAAAVPVPSAPAAENHVIVDPPPRVQEEVAVRRDVGTTASPDVPVRTAEARRDDAPVNTPQVAASPFSAAPGSVAAVPLPPVAPAEEERPRPAPVGATPSDPAPAAALPAVDEAARVRSVLARYEAAYSTLDANAAQSVWPGVDGRSLARAFQGLQSQRVSLGQCALAIDGSTAHADCDGSATWTPKIGGGSRTETRHYKFELQNNGGTWQILTASAR